MKKKLLIWGILIVVILFLIPYSLPLIFAFVTAMVLERLVEFFQARLKLKRIYAVTITFAAFLISIGAFSYFTVVILIRQLVTFSSKLPQIISDTTSVINSYILKWQSFSTSIPDELINSIENSFRSIRDSLIEMASHLTESIIVFLTTIPGFLIHLLIFLIALFLFSLDLPNIKKRIILLFSDATRERILIVFHQLNRAGIGFIKAQLLLSLITFLLALTGMFLLKVEYAAVFALITVVVDLLPILGTGSFLVPWAIYSFINNDQTLGIGLIVIFFVITVVRRAIEPKVFSTSMGIGALSALISIYLGFQIFGFIGLVVGPAIVIVFDTLVKAGIINLKFKI
jgi:sporulation integral membrane protein YtvI